MSPEICPENCPETPKGRVAVAVLAATLVVALTVVSTSTTASAQMVQGVYAGNDPTLTAIDVYYTVGPISVGKSDDVGGGEAVAFLEVPANLSITASIADASSNSISDAFYSDSYSFPADTNYIQIVNGLRSPGDYAPNPDGRSTAVAVHEIDNVRRFASNPDSTDLIVYHGSTDSPELDVTLGSAGQVAGGLSYGEVGDYFTVPTGEQLTFDIRRASDGEVVGSFVGGLSAAWTGRAGVLLIRGFADPSANPGGVDLGVTVVSSTGSSFDFSAVTGTGVAARDEASESGDRAFDAMYPNPAAEATTVEFAAAEPGPATIRVFDLLGRQVRGSQRVDVVRGTNTVDVDLNGLASGWYSIVVDGASVGVVRGAVVVR